MPLPVLPAWPFGIEWRPRRAPFADKPYEPVRATKMEAGNTHREEQDSDEVVKQTVLWRFTPDEWTQAMRPFFIAVRATGWQGFYVDAGGGIRTGHITVDGEPPAGVPTGRLINVTATLDIIPDDLGVQ
jgi:hypothetical protein